MLSDYRDIFPTLPKVDAVIRQWKCANFGCDWIGDDTQYLRALDPFNSGNEIIGCPKCRTINMIVAGCDEPGCTDFGTCGMPTQNGYRITCGKHMPHINDMKIFT